MIDQYVLDELEEALDENSKPLLQNALNISNNQDRLTALDIFFILKEVYDKAYYDGMNDAFNDGS